MLTITSATSNKSALGITVGVGEVVGGANLIPRLLYRLVEKENIEVKV